jgi:hypothetical protein
MQSALLISAGNHCKGKTEQIFGVCTERHEDETDLLINRSKESSDFLL